MLQQPRDEGRYLLRTAWLFDKKIPDEQAGEWGFMPITTLAARGGANRISKDVHAENAMRSFSPLGSG